MSNNILMVEGTTRYVEIACLDEQNNPFDFTGYTIQTHLGLNGRSSYDGYLETFIENNTVTFVIEAGLTVGMTSGSYETRIFKDSEVVSVISGKITIKPSEKPDISYHGV